MSTRGSSHTGRSPRSAARPSRSPPGAGAERRTPRSAGRPTPGRSRWWKEERHGVFLDYNQNAKDRTVASAYSVRPTPEARVSAPLAWDELPECRAEAFTLDTVPE